MQLISCAYVEVCMVSGHLLRTAAVIGNSNTNCEL